MVGNNDPQKHTSILQLSIIINFNRFSTDQYIELSQPHNVRETIPCNCDIVVLNINEKPVPVVFATKAIQRDEMLSICLETITKFNEDYFSRREKYTEDGENTFFTNNASWFCLVFKRFFQLYLKIFQVQLEKVLEFPINQH